MLAYFDHELMQGRIDEFAHVLGSAIPNLVLKVFDPSEII
jgi:hypothetical protein